MSVNTGGPKDVPWDGGVIRTSFFRTPRTGRVRVGPLGLEGDEVSNPAVHGGPRKLVYAYPSEHYAGWQETLGVPALPWGSFGENLTVEGLHETDLRPGDVLVVGSLRLRVTQPRSPCVKLNVRFQRRDMIDLFFRAGRPGFYLGLDTPGDVAAGDGIEVAPGDGTGPTIAEMFRARAAEPR